MRKNDISFLKKYSRFLWIVVVFFIGVFGVFHHLLVNSDACLISIETAKRDMFFQDKIGKKVDIGFWITGKINHMGDNSSANFIIPVTGEKGKGTLEAVVEKPEGTWEVEIKGVRVKLTTGLYV